MKGLSPGKLRRYEITSRFRAVEGRRGDDMGGKKFVKGKGGVGLEG